MMRQLLDDFETILGQPWKQLKGFKNCSCADYSFCLCDEKCHLLSFAFFSLQCDLMVHYSRYCGKECQRDDWKKVWSFWKTLQGLFYSLSVVSLSSMSWFEFLILSRIARKNISITPSLIYYMIACICHGQANVLSFGPKIQNRLPWPNPITRCTRHSIPWPTNLAVKGWKITLASPTSISECWTLNTSDCQWTHRTLLS